VLSGIVLNLFDLLTKYDASVIAAISDVSFQVQDTQFGTPQVNRDLPLNVDNQQISRHDI
ncbi:ABC transporter ATP-binding protein, partial [Staphylococcus pseudintermedius]